MSLLRVALLVALVALIMVVASPVRAPVPSVKAAAAPAVVKPAPAAKVAAAAAGVPSAPAKKFGPDGREIFRVLGVDPAPAAQEYVIVKEEVDDYREDNQRQPRTPKYRNVRVKKQAPGAAQIANGKK